MPTWLRIAASSPPLAVSRLPSTTTVPSCTASRPLMQRISVLLPEPDGPITTTTSPVATARSMSASTWFVPNHFWTPENSMAVDGGIRQHLLAGRTPVPWLAPRARTPKAAHDAQSQHEPHGRAHVVVAQRHVLGRRQASLRSAGPRAAVDEPRRAPSVRRRDRPPAAGHDAVSVPFAQRAVGVLPRHLRRSGRRVHFQARRTARRHKRRRAGYRALRRRRQPDR